MPDELIVYGADWCLQAVRTARFLEKKQIPFTWIDVDQSQEASARVRSINNGNRSIPTLVFEDGTTLTEPGLKELAETLGLDT